MTGKWLQFVESALSQAGFHTAPLSATKCGEVFSMVRKLGEIWDMRARGFGNGELEAVL